MIFPTKTSLFRALLSWSLTPSILLAIASFTANAQSTQAPPETSVAPDTPVMSAREMAVVMQMNDAARIGKVMLDRLEWRVGDGSDSAIPSATSDTTSGANWDAQAWYGSDFNKLWLKSEGERAQDNTAARTELLWDKVVSLWWSAQLGARVDTNVGPTRGWAAIGIQGLAPYWFDTQATLYIGDAGRAAARVTISRDLLFSQRLVLQAESEINLYKKADTANRIDSGVSNLQLGLRLRYEFRREVAPYIGCIWSENFGEHVHSLQATLGVRMWF